MSVSNITEVMMPQLAESLIQATIGKWLKHPGETFDAYEPICEVITDKVVAELPAMEAGIMREILVQEGETVAVGTIICRMESRQGTTPSVVSVPGDEGIEQTQSAIENVTTIEKGSRNQRYSPAVQRLAQEYGIDLQYVSGTGLDGRITRKDVRAAIEADGRSVIEPSTSTYVTSIPSTEWSDGGIEPNISSPHVDESVRRTSSHLAEVSRDLTIGIEENQQAGSKEMFIDVTPIRHTIATKMHQSVAEIPHAWMMVEVDVTNLVQLRNAVKDEFRRKEGINLTYLAFVLKAIVNAIKDYPIMNSVWAVDKIIVKRDINLSLAVGTKDSVLTPVIKQSDQKNIAGLAREIDKIACKTREGTLSLQDMQDGTFTVNNTGSFGSVLSYPIINYPQAAILTFEAIVKKPVVINEMIAVRSMAHMCLSLDHRILDGVICGQFLQRVKENLESLTLDTKVY